MESMLEPYSIEMVKAWLAKDYDLAFQCREIYLQLLFAFGWTEENFNAEMLSQIDQAWFEDSIIFN